MVNSSVFENNPQYSVYHYFLIFSIIFEILTGSFLIF